MKWTDISEGAIGICQIDQRLGDRLKRELQKVICRERMRRKRAGEADHLRRPVRRFERKSFLLFVIFLH